MKIKSMLVTTTLALGLSVQAFADTTSALNTEASRMNTLATNRGESHVVDKISGDFSSFLGSDAKPVVSGLRNGTPITLVTTTPGSTPTGPPVTSTTIITPPTGKMGFGNAYISLALAKQQLNQVGITQPTPQQLQAALTGGTVTTGSGPTLATHNLQGILTMRSQNMGWGQIAQKLGTKLGPVVSGMKSANQNMTTASVSSASAGTQSSTASGSGIVAGSGKPHGNSGQEVSGQNRSGEGIVSGSGRSTPGGNAYGKGIVSGSGQAAGGNSGITTAGGHGNSSGQGKSK
jgi:hypothetical protein